MIHKTSVNEQTITRKDKTNQRQSTGYGKSRTGTFRARSQSHKTIFDVQNSRLSQHRREGNCTSQFAYAVWTTVSVYVSSRSHGCPPRNTFPYTDCQRFMLRYPLRESQTSRNTVSTSRCGHPRKYDEPTFYSVSQPLSDCVHVVHYKPDPTVSNKCLDTRPSNEMT